MKKLLCVLSLLSLSVAAEEVKIISQKFEADEKKRISIFTGNVNIQKGNDELNASKVKIFLDEKKQPKKYEAIGKVSIYAKMQDSNETYSGKAKRVIYQPKENKYYFYDNVKLIQINEGRTLTGKKVILDVTTGHAKVIGNKKEPVVVTFTIEDKNTTKKAK